MTDPTPITRLTAALEGRYRIEGQLGEGGMATVYLAEDLKHERKVAVKVLKPELAAVIGAERFVAEIKTTASLQHPNILPLFDSGEADSFLYYVMPYVEGETLREKLHREKQLGVEEAVRIGREVADALDYAHRNGVLHRDIKPANILLHDGRPVVADFGIAVAISAAGGGRLTETGLSLGTPHYMSPEQATADRDLSARSDVYSLGCVVYEMLTGDPPHTASTAQAVLVRILTEVPRGVTEVRTSVPPHVAAAVSKALEKLPADRFESASAFRDALEDPAFTHLVRPTAPRGVSAAQSVPAASASGPRGWRGWAPWAVAAVAAALALRLALSPAPDPQVTRTELNLPDEGLRPAAPFRGFDISPDGRTLVYVGGEDASLYLRALDQLTAVELPGTDRANAPSFSPDGTAVAFHRSGEGLLVVSTQGAPPLNLVPGLFPGVAWGDDGHIYFSREGDLFRVPERGGEVLAVLADSTAALVNVSFVVGEGLLLFTSVRSDLGTSTLEVLDLGSGDRHELAAGAGAAFLAPDYLTYTTADGTLLVAPFDPGSLELGRAAPMIEGISTGFRGHPGFSLSRAGHLVYHSGGRSDTGEEVLVSVDRQGNRTELAPDRVIGDFEAVDFSPDGRYVAVMMQTGTTGGSSGDIWVYDAVQETFGPVTVTPEREDLPAWSSDGRFIYFVVIGGERSKTLYRVPADASGEAEPVISSEFLLEDVDFSADGRFAVMKVQGEGEGDDIVYADLAGDSVVRPFLTTRFDEEGVAVSPDGRWLAYESPESGRDEIYIRAFPGGGGRIPISLDGGRDPVWAHSGRELFYIGEDDRLVVAQLDIDETVAVTDRESLFSVEGFECCSGEIQWAIAPDDQSFLFFADRGATGIETDGGHLTLILNWAAELKNRMRGGN